MRVAAKKDSIINIDCSIMVDRMLARRTLWGTLMVLTVSTTTVEGAADLEYPNQTLSLIRFGSCHKLKYAKPGLWSTILQGDSRLGSSSNNNKNKKRPDLFLWTGDSIYPPKRGVAPVELLVKEYHRMKTNNTVAYGQQLLTNNPNKDVNNDGPILTLGSYDDHDYGANDLGKFMPDKPQRRDAFWEFLGLTTALNNLQHRQGAYFSALFGSAVDKQVKVILLDTRWHRDNHCVPSVAGISWLPLGAGFACLFRWLSAGLFPTWCAHRQETATILGQEQWTWLEEQLMESAADVHIVVSSIQVLTTNPTMEGWGHFPHERRRLIDLLRQTKGALILSGDVHHAEILNPAAHMHHVDNAFLEVTSSGLTHSCTKGLFGKLCVPLLTWFSKHRWHYDARYVDRNFGQIDIDWGNEQLEVSVLDAQSGETVLTTGPRAFEQYSNWTTEDLEGVVECMDGHLIPLAQGVAVLLALLLILSLRVVLNTNRQAFRKEKVT